MMAILVGWLAETRFPPFTGDTWTRRPTRKRHTLERCTAQINTTEHNDNAGRLNSINDCVA